MTIHSNCHANKHLQGHKQTAQMLPNTGLCATNVHGRLNAPGLPHIESLESLKESFAQKSQMQIRILHQIPHQLNISITRRWWLHLSRDLHAIKELSYGC